MALFDCPECGQRISNRAHSCPRCGCPVDDESARVATPAPVPIETDAIPEYRQNWTSDVVCPPCGDQSQLIKVSAIVAAQSSVGSSRSVGTAQTSLTGMVLGQPYSNYSTNTQSQSASQSVLATLLRLTDKPDPFGASIKAVVVLVVLMVLAITWVSSVLHISGAISLGTWGFAGIGWWRWYRQLSRAWEFKYSQAAILWQGAYYCPKHDLVVLAEFGGLAVQPAEFGALVRPAFGIFDMPPKAAKPALSTGAASTSEPVVL